MAKSQNAPEEFWIEYKKIATRSSNITEEQIVKLRKLMELFKLNR